ncbi:hypothetical protein V8E36_003455 [Tilletia maclaganii]
MSNKHIFNDAEGLVEQSLAGVAATSHNLRFHKPAKVVYDATWSTSSSASPSPVALVAGGGAGHEPAFAGYVGKGMLAAAVSGDIFASPSTRQIGVALDLLRLSSSSPSSAKDKSQTPPPKVIFIVLQYSGDALNFGVAQQKARQAGWEAEVVLVGDDVSVGRQQGSRVGRRGLAAQVFVIKALGAVLASTAEEHREIASDVRRLAELGRVIARHAATMGVSLDHCHIPGSSTQSWAHLGAQQVGLGVGIHNEPGVRLLDSTPSASELVQTLLKFILDKSDKERAYFAYKRDDRIVLVVNNLGGISTLELNAVAHEAVQQLQANGGKEAGLSRPPAAVFAGTYLSSLNAPGFSLSLINLDRIQKECGVEILSLLQAPTEAVGWTGSRGAPSDDDEAASAPSAEDLYARVSELGIASTSSSSTPLPDEQQSQEESAISRGADWNPALVRTMLVSAADALIAAEPEITRLDTVQGDGDCGTTLRSLARAVRSSAAAAHPSSDDDKKEDPAWLQTPLSTVRHISEIVEGSMGGTSGALYALFFSALGASLRAGRARGGEEGGGVWGPASLEALESLSQFTPARKGDRTLIDALDPFVRTLASSSSSSTTFEDAVKASRAGAEATAGMVARLGRAAYVGEQRSEHDCEGREKAEGGEKRLPDPGAIGVAVLVEGLLEGYKKGGERRSL